jgi:hypothetical protein
MTIEGVIFVWVIGLLILIVLSISVACYIAIR